MKCEQCNVEMQPLRYCCDDDYGIHRSRVENDKGEILGNLRYCPNCGNVKVQMAF